MTVKDTEIQIARGAYPSWRTEEVASIHNDQGVPFGELVRSYQRRKIDLIHLDNMIFQHSLNLIGDGILDSVLRAWLRGLEDPIIHEVINNGIVHLETMARLKEIGYQFEN